VGRTTLCNPSRKGAPKQRHTTQALHRLSMLDEVIILQFFNGDTGEYQDQPWPAPNSRF
jgi:hypothetical protein